MCCQPCFFPECAANHVFPRICCQPCFSPECAANHVFFPRMCSQSYFSIEFTTK
jgi:hypothetical protein